MYRDHTKVIKIGNRVIGGGNPILIQSMTNTKTEDVEATVAQILSLEKAGCDIIRCAVPTMEAAKALSQIKKQIHIPLVADIHFDYRLAIAAMENGADKVVVNTKNLDKFLGKSTYSYLMANKKDEVGIARGLAWTQVGGDTLQIEVNIMPGKGEFVLTGQLGDVMKESATAGISYIRSVAARYGINQEFFQENDIHVHIPEGAVPKDGPSAGITMATAMLSAIIDKPVRADLAMTGEITLRGRVLPIGGLKEKLLAAKYAKIKEVLVPKSNKPDIKELDEEITDGLKITFVENMNEVLERALA